MVLDERVALLSPFEGVDKLAFRMKSKGAYVAFRAANALHVKGSALIRQPALLVATSAG
jgi:hypothetical protein